MELSILFIEHSPAGDRILQERFGADGFSYQSGLAALIDERSWWSDYYVTAFRELGHAAEVIYPGVRSLQSQWALESGLSPSLDPAAVLIAQIRASGASVVFLHQDQLVLDRRLHARIRKECRGVELILGYFGTYHWKVTERVQGLDALFVPCRWMVEEYRKQSVPVYRLRHAFGEAALDLMDPLQTKDLPFTMVGNLDFKGGLFEERNQLVEELMARTPLQVWGRVGMDGRTTILKAKASWVLNSLLRGVGVPIAVRKAMPLIQWGAEWSDDPTQAKRRFPQDRVHPPTFGRGNWEILSRSRVVFNAHADIARQESVNFRLFEATGAGACLLTNHTSDLAELFDVDREVVSYQGREEAVEKARYLLDHDKEREAIARAGHARCLRDHTYRQRAKEVLDLLPDLPRCLNPERC